MMAGHGQRDTERRFVEQLRSRFEDQGFAFEPYPDAAQLPDFMAKYRPDAIARKGEQNVAIEVKVRQTSSAEPNLDWIRKLFDGHPDWQLRVVFMGDDPQRAVTIAAATPAMVQDHIAKARALLDQKQRRAAFFEAWSSLEAAFRSSDGAQAGRLHTPGTIVQSLAMNGRITPETETQVRDLIGLRDRIVHGDLQAEPTDDQVDLVLSASDAALRPIEP